MSFYVPQPKVVLVFLGYYNNPGALERFYHSPCITLHGFYHHFKYGFCSNFKPYLHKYFNWIHKLYQSVNFIIVKTSIKAVLSVRIWRNSYQMDTLVQKCQYYHTLLIQIVPLVTVRSNDSLLTEQLCKASTFQIIFLKIFLLD